MSLADRVRSLIRDVPDFPKPGIVFKDITPVLRNPSAFGGICTWVAEIAEKRRATVLAGIESRGFLFAAAAAAKCGLGIVPIRKRGKLPWKTVTESYKLEYGEAAIEVHEDAFTAEDNVLVVDDLLATGGTAEASGRLVSRLGATLAGYLFVVELTFLQGRERLVGQNIASLVQF